MSGESPGREGTSVVPMTLAEEDQRQLVRAVEILENPGFIARISDLVGTPIEVVIDKLPSAASSKIDRAVHHAMRAALNLATSSLRRGRARRARNRLHLAAAGTAGAVGGAFGLGALAVELPITTTIILRSVADVARSEGEDLRRAESRLACLEVLAYGGRTTSDDASESGYFAVRAALAQAAENGRARTARSNGGRRRRSTSARRSSPRSRRTAGSAYNPPIGLDPSATSQRSPARLRLLEQQHSPGRPAVGEHDVFPPGRGVGRWGPGVVLPDRCRPQQRRRVDVHLLALVAAAG